MCHNRHCYGTDGTWELEPPPSSRTEAWILNHRFDLDTALDHARRLAPDATVNGLTAAEVAEGLRREP